MEQWHIIVNGQQSGPISLEELKQRIDAGSVTAKDLVWRQGMQQWQPAGSVAELFDAGQVPQGMPGSYLKPHRGGAILALGILGLLVCFVMGIVAWVMGNNDLREMTAGQMDRSGEQLTMAGRICGIISTVLAIVGCAGSLIWFIIMAVVGIASHS